MIEMQLELFLLLAVGFFLGRKGMISSATRDQLTDIVIDIILPCSILSSFQMEMSADILVSSAQVLLAAFGMQLLYGLLNRFLYRRFAPDEQAACKYSTMVTNASFIGIPVVSALYGQTGMLYASIFVIPQRIFMWAYGLPLYTAVDKKNIAKKIVTHPCVLSIFIGLGLMVLYSFGIRLPGFTSLTLDALGSCTTPLCFLIIGSIVSDMNWRDMVNVRALLFSFYRLLIIPVLLILAFRLVPADPLVRNVCVVLSAMPAPTTTVILAQKYGRSPQFASNLLMTSTLLSMITIPIITGLLSIG